VWTFFEGDLSSEKALQSIDLFWLITKYIYAYIVIRVVIFTYAYENDLRKPMVEGIKIAAVLVGIYWLGFAVAGLIASPISSFFISANISAYRNLAAFLALFARLPLLFIWNKNFNGIAKWAIEFKLS